MLLLGTIMNAIFYFNQFKFMNKILDRELHKGLCLTMCIDFIYNKKNRLPCNLIYFSQGYRFASRQRALSYGVEGGKIRDAVLFPDRKLKSRFKSYVPSPISNTKIASCVFAKGDYLINIYNIDNTGHAIALRNHDSIELFDPNKGLFALEYISELTPYINNHYLNKGIYIYEYL
jgi:hypothetical protein